MVTNKSLAVIYTFLNLIMIGGFILLSYLGYFETTESIISTIKATTAWNFDKVLVIALALLPWIIAFYGSSIGILQMRMASKTLAYLTAIIWSAAIFVSEWFFVKEGTKVGLLNISSASRTELITLIALPCLMGIVNIMLLGKMFQADESTSGARKFGTFILSIPVGFLMVTSVISLVGWIYSLVININEVIGYIFNGIAGILLLLTLIFMVVGIFNPGTSDGCQGASRSSSTCHNFSDGFGNTFPSQDQATSSHNMKVRNAINNNNGSPFGHENQLW